MEWEGRGVLCETDVCMWDGMCVRVCVVCVLQAKDEKSVQEAGWVAGQYEGLSASKVCMHACGGCCACGEGEIKWKRDLT